MDDQMRRGRVKLAARRRAKGHTQESLAEVLDVAVSTVARWEQGRGGPLPSLRRPLAEALSLSLDSLDRLLNENDESKNEGGGAPDTQSPPVRSSLATVIPGHRGQKRQFDVDEPKDRLREGLARLYQDVAGAPELFTIPSPSLGGGLTPPPIDRRTFLSALGGLACMPYRVGSAAPAGVSRMDPERVDDDLVSSFWRLFEEYSVADWTLGPRHLLATANGILGFLDASLCGSPGGQNRDGLLEVGTRWAEFVGWLHQDAGAVTNAGWCADRAMEWAQEAGDGLMVSYVLVRKSDLAATDGDGARTVGLARAAQREPRLPSRVRAVALQQEAHGHALMGDGTACTGKLDEARDAAERGWGDGDDPRDPARYCVPEYVEIQRATCWWLLGQPRRAAEAFEQGLAGLPDVHRRDRGVYLARLALASADAGDPEPAAAAAGDALRIAHDTGSGRIWRELEQLRPKLGRWRDRSEVAALHALLPGWP